MCIELHSQADVMCSIASAAKRENINNQATLAGTMLEHSGFFRRNLISFTLK